MRAEGNHINFTDDDLRVLVSCYCYNTTNQSATYVTGQSVSDSHTDDGGGNAITIVLPICIVILAVIISVIIIIIYRRRKGSLKNEDRAKFTPETVKLNQEENKTDTVECLSEMEELNQKEEKPSIDTEPIAVQLSETKKVSIDGEFTYSNKFNNEEEIKAKVMPILNNCGIVVLISENKPAMTNVALSVAKDFPDYEKAIRFYEWYTKKSDPSKPTCVIFDDCLKNEQGDHINFDSQKFHDLCDAIYEVRRNSKGNLKFIITVPQMLWNARRIHLESLKLFHDMHILKFNLDKPQ